MVHVSGDRSIIEGIYIYINLLVGLTHIYKPCSYFEVLPYYIDHNGIHQYGVSVDQGGMDDSPKYDS